MNQAVPTQSIGYYMCISFISYEGTIKAQLFGRRGLYNLWDQYYRDVIHWNNENKLHYLHISCIYLKHDCSRSKLNIHDCLIGPLIEKIRIEYEISNTVYVVFRSIVKVDGC